VHANIAHSSKSRDLADLFEKRNNAVQRILKTNHPRKVSHDSPVRLKVLFDVVKRQVEAFSRNDEVHHSARQQSDAAGFASHDI
jgi:hypothetical protein